MYDPMTRTEPVPLSPLLGKGVSVSLAPPLVRYSLRASTGEALETLLGVPVPKSIGRVEGQIACLGPDEWLLRGEAGTQLATDAGLPVAITDISERAVCFTIVGPRAAALLMTGCPLDLDQLAVGHATRTIFETVEIIVIREADDLFQVEVWRSFANWLWTALTTAARH